MLSVCLSVCPVISGKLTLSSGGVAMPEAIGVLNEKHGNGVFSLFWVQFQIKSRNNIPVFGDPKTIIFHCFLTSLIRSSDLGSVDWGFPKTVTFDCWNSLHVRFAPLLCRVLSSTAFEVRATARATARTLTLSVPH